MAYKIILDCEKNPTRIEGWCDIPGWDNRQNVIVFSMLYGEWHTASSMCFPSNIDSAIRVHKCISGAFDELSKHQGGKLL